MKYRTNISADEAARLLGRPLNTSKPKPEGLRLRNSKTVRKDLLKKRLGVDFRPSVMTGAEVEKFRSEIPTQHSGNSLTRCYSSRLLRCLWATYEACKVEGSLAMRDQSSISHDDLEYALAVHTLWAEIERRFGVEYGRRDR